MVYINATIYNKHVLLLLPPFDDMLCLPLCLMCTATAPTRRHCDVASACLHFKDLRR